MTPEEMDRAIAEHLGWEFIPCHDDGLGRATGESWRDPDGDIGPFPPSYSTDLNAMHEAEKTLTDRDPYLRELQTVTQTWDHVDADGDEVDWFWELATATAAQRAEAFLRTIGKWRDA